MPAPLHIRKGEYYITTDPSKFDFDRIFHFLSIKSYWAKNISMAAIKKSVENSLSFGVFHNDRQIGFARVITDYATTGYLCDVFIDEDYRGQGHSKWLIETINSHPDLQGFRRWVLVTADAHKLYEKIGFKPVATPEKYMERVNPKAYNVDNNW